MKKKAEGRIISEPVEDSINDTNAKMNKNNIVGIGISVAGGAVTVGGVIAGSTIVTALGVATIAGGCAYYMLGGNNNGKKTKWR